MPNGEVRTETTGSPARILVVDDRADAREILQAHLENSGYQVVTATNGQEALDAVAAHPPDLILLDVMMPRIDGFEVCRRLKSNEETAFIPIVMLTALQDFEYRLRGIALGADDFLGKPFNQLELQSRVRSLLRVKSLHDQVAAHNRLLEARVAERTAALQQALAELKELDRLKSEFVCNVSHELRTPLTPIKGYLPAILREEFGGLSDDQRRVLGDVAECVERLHRLIEDLLLFMQWESGQGILRLGTVHVPTLVESGLARIAPLASEKGVGLRADTPSNLPRILADSHALDRVLGHLLDNALKFTPRGGEISVTTRVVAEPPADSHPEDTGLPRRGRLSDLAGAALDGRFVELTLHDSGVGIPPEAVPKIFDRFYQADSSSTRRHGGTGLGLAIVKRILDAHGALVSVESQPGQGTTFRIHLPVAA